MRPGPKWHNSAVLHTLLLFVLDQNEPQWSEACIYLANSWHWERVCRDGASLPVCHALCQPPSHSFVCRANPVSSDSCYHNNWDKSITHVGSHRWTRTPSTAFRHSKAHTKKCSHILTLTNTPLLLKAALGLRRCTQQDLILLSNRLAGFKNNMLIGQLSGLIVSIVQQKQDKKILCSHLSTWSWFVFKGLSQLHFDLGSGARSSQILCTSKSSNATV